MTPVGDLFSRLGSGIRVIVRRWESVQVELHGRYSMERFTSVQKSFDLTSGFRALGILATNLIPALVCVAVVDAFPLEPPNLGLAHTATLWIRELVFGFLFSYAVEWEFCDYVAELQISKRVLGLTAVAATLVTNAIGVCLMMLFWYPMPFTLVWVIGPWLGTLGMALKISRGDFMRKHSIVQQEVRLFSVVFVTQTSTVVVYTILNAIFAAVPSHWQPVAALIVPIFKITHKNVMCRLLHGRDDLKPEIVAFEIEVFNAFFISSSIQRIKSINACVLLILVDMLQMLLSLYDLRSMRKNMEGFARKMGITADEAVNVALMIAAKYPQLRDRSQSIDRLTRSKEDVLFLPSPRRPTTRATVKFGRSKALIVPVSTLSAVNSIEIARFSGSKIMSRIVPLKTFAVTCGSAKFVEGITTRERQLLLDKALQIMFFTEFLLLSKFLGMFTPVLYSIYMVITYYWPNRAFYSHFNSVDETQLWQNILNTFVYALLETGLFSILSIAIYRSAHRYPLQQLAYAIKSCWGRIQAKLVIWMLLSLQFSIVHMGTDYTFKFEWIHKP